MEENNWKNKSWELETNNRELKEIVRNLYTVIVRTLVIGKYLIRLLSVLAAYHFLGQDMAVMLGVFILVTAFVQWGIDKTRQAVNPKVKMSEWDVDLG
jgi:hypothetical protein